MTTELNQNSKEKEKRQGHVSLILKNMVPCGLFEPTLIKKKMGDRLEKSTRVSYLVV